MGEKQKILVCGDVDGKFKTLFSRVETVNKKSGPFDFLLCVGTFFGSSQDTWEPYRKGFLSVPIPTYVLGPTEEEQVQFYPDMKGCELCCNVSYIGKRGLFTGSSGFKLAYVSGKHSSDDHTHDHTFTKSDVLAVRDICFRTHSNFKGVDILASSSWPKDVTNLDRRKGLQEPDGSSLLSWLACQIKPRYYFCAQDYYYERRPYRNYNTAEGMEGTLQHATRFITLAKVGNPTKEKWLYALSIDPIDQMSSSALHQQTTDETECPFPKDLSLETVRKEKTAQYFYDLNSASDGGGRKRSRKDDEFRSKKRQPPIFDQASCWFCLASPDVEKHLVISIGSEAYLALAKGPLVPDHVLILPVGHHQSLSCLPDSVLKEIKQFKSALKKLYAKSNKVPVFFERNYKTSHLQVQVVPVPSKVSSILKDEFQKSAETEGFHLDELPKHAKLEQVAPPGTPYFYIELPTGKNMYHRVQKNFPLQFGRTVLAGESILNVADRADWKDCKMSKEDENAMMKNFRTSFTEFDFTLA